MRTLFTTLLSATMLMTAATGSAQRKDTIPAPSAKRDSIPAPSVKQLKEVNVTSSAPPITMQGGTMVVNVSKSATAAGSNAWEIVSKSPGVTADNNNTLQLNGRNVSVYIDGRPSRLSGDDLKNLLNSTPGSNIEKLELMSNPSAKYDAQDGAIINIKMLKSKDMGTNGSVTVGGGFGRYPRSNTGFTLNHRTKKATLYGGYDYIYAKQFVHTTAERFFPGNYTLEDSDYNREERNSHNLKAGADFDLSKSTTAGFLVKSMFNNRHRANDNQTTLPDSIFRQTATGRQTLVNPSVNVYFKTGSEKHKNELSINADYFNHSKDWNDDFNGHYFTVKEVPSGDPTYIRNNTESRINLYSLSADYTQQLKFAKLEAGLKTTFTETDNDTRWENQFNGQWENDGGKTNHFIYKENVNAAYAGLTKTIKKYTIQAMLRAEHTHATGNSLTMDQKFERDYVQLFPSASVSYMKSARDQFSFSYRRSITRFGFDIVNPFVTYQNAYSYRQGNPNIKPVLSQTIQGTWSHNYSLFTTLGFNIVKDNLSMIFNQDPDTKVQITSFDNQTDFNVAYLNLVWVKPITPKIRTTWTVTGLWLDISTNMNGIAYQKSSVTGMVNMQNTFTLPKGFTAELNGNFRGPFMAGYAVMKPAGGLDFGVTKNVLKNKGSLKLGIVDIFNTQPMRFEVKYANVHNLAKMNNDTRVVNLTFNYKFGSNTVKAAKTRKNAIESEAGRTNAQQGL
ncbi:outer membrane beta-barrel family protein [Chitinophaga sp. YIM B06452]|uniref:outer membrane beta-barrel family protein n=1 Tax=Chitinophaga sp. YIM B06452 TaxID=3082158 RepID=UPI0031FF00EB